MIRIRALISIRVLVHIGVLAHVRIWTRILSVGHELLLFLHDGLSIKEILIFFPLLLIFGDVDLLCEHDFPVFINPDCILHFLLHDLFLILKLSFHLVDSFLLCFFLILVSKF